MITFVNHRLRFLALLTLVGASIGMVGCGQKAVDTKSEAAAFAGDPAIKAKMGAEMRAKAQQGQAQAEAAARAKAQPPASGAPSGTAAR